MDPRIPTPGAAPGPDLRRVRRSGPAIDGRDVLVLYVRELRSALRERSIVVNGILVPIFLYPFLFWLALTALTFVEGLSEATVSRVVLEGVPQAHRELEDSLHAAPSVALLEATVGDEPADAVREARVDAWVRILPPAPGGEALADNFRVRITYDRAIDRSRTAEQRVEEVVERYRDRWLERSAASLRMDPDEIEPFRMESSNVASEEDMGAFLLATMIPLFLVIMVALGCFIPAIDTTAGERERSTWETLMTVSASRTSIVTAKYLYVATLGMLAGALNVLAVTVSLGPVLGPLGGEVASGFDFSFPATAVPVMILGAAVLALFFGAAMMILASFARTFKEGQAMVTPVYWLALLPVLIGNSPDQRLTAGMALVPIANVALMVKDAIHGVYDWPLIGLTLLVGLALVAVSLWAAQAVLRFEELLLGSYDGSFWTFLRDRGRARRRGRRRAEAGA